MAKIQGITPGLMPVDIEAPKIKKIPQPAAKTEVVHCRHCAGEMAKRDLKAYDALDGYEDDEDEDSGFCLACAGFFGLGIHHGRGVTNVDPAKAKERVEQAEEYGWAMVMRRGNFAAPGGTSFEVEPGDCFRVVRAGVKDLAPICHRDYVAARFSIDCQVGPIVLKQWPHEFTPVSQVYLMSLVADGELEVKYLATNDETGYYTPTPALREQLNHMFG